MKKNHGVQIRLSAEELEKIKKKAQASGMSISTFLRTLGLNAVVEIH